MLPTGHGEKVGLMMLVVQTAKDMLYVPGREVATIMPTYPDLVYSGCAIPGRSRFALLSVETMLKSRTIPHFKRLSAMHANESPWIEDFMLGLRLLINPLNVLHKRLLQRWKVDTKGTSTSADACAELAPSPPRQSGKSS